MDSTPGGQSAQLIELMAATGTGMPVITTSTTRRRISAFFTAFGPYRPG